MDEFSAACGATHPIRLKIDNGKGVSRVVTLVRPFAIIGGNPAADIRLDHIQVCRRHAYLQVLGGRLWVIDLSIRGGLQWPHGRPVCCGPLDPGDSLGIGPFTIHRPTDEARAVDGYDGYHDPLRDQPPGPSPILYGLDAGGPASWGLTQVINLLGRSLLCRVRLEGSSISQNHAALVRTPAGLWMVDLLGRGGVSVNGVATRYGLLESGDVLGIGQHRVSQHRLTLRAGSEALARPISPASLPALTATAITVMAQAAPDRPESLAPIRPELITEAASRREGEVGPVLLMFIEQMGRMQQQMLDQFQQAMQMIFELASERQREDRAQIHEEIGRLRQLAGELEVLKARLEPPGPAALGQPPAAPPVAEKRPDPIPIDRAAAIKPLASVGPRPDTEPQGDSLAWICRRLHEMQDEQQHRWSRVARLLKRGAG